jgi:hypothetical protein
LPEVKSEAASDGVKSVVSHSIGGTAQ